jgi:hypothetical protein
MMDIRDLLCDKCLYMMESTPDDTDVSADDLCNRCRAKVLAWCEEALSVVSEPEP